MKLDRIYQIVIVALVVTITILSFKLNRVKKKYTTLETKLNSIKDNTTLIDSIKYETVQEIWSKNIIISDSLITDERTLYLVEKYTR